MNNSKTKPDSNHKREPELVRVCTDMIYVNLQVKSEEHQEELRQNLEQYSKELGVPVYSKQGYRYAIQLMKEEQSKGIYYCIDHKFPNHGYVHLQGNTSELDKSMATSLSGDLKYLLGDLYPDFIRKSTVTRLDIAADFINLKMDDISIKNLRQRSSGAFWGQNGQLQTLYIGHSTSKFKIKAYDKTAEIKAKSRSRSKGTVVGDGPQVTRIEASINPNCSFNHIASIGNPFEGIEIYKLSDLVADRRLPFSFSDSIHHRGLVATLKLLEPSERKAVKKLLEDHVYQDFPADEIFQQWKLSWKILNPLKIPKTKAS